jgi:hypothetical protein
MEMLWVEEVNPLSIPIARLMLHNSSLFLFQSLQ